MSLRLGAVGSVIGWLCLCAGLESVSLTLCRRVCVSVLSLCLAVVVAVVAGLGVVIVVVVAVAAVGSGVAAAAAAATGVCKINDATKQNQPSGSNTQ